MIIVFINGACENLKEINLNKSNIKEISVSYMDDNETTIIKLPKTIKKIKVPNNNDGKGNFCVQNKDVCIEGNTSYIKFMDLESLIESRKTFREANNIIKDMQR